MSAAIQWTRGKLNIVCHVHFCLRECFNVTGRVRVDAYKSIAQQAENKPKVSIQMVKVARHCGRRATVLYAIWHSLEFHGVGISGKMALLPPQHAFASCF